MFDFGLAYVSWSLEAQYGGFNFGAKFRYDFFVFGEGVRHLTFHWMIRDFIIEGEMIY